MRFGRPFRAVSLCVPLPGPKPWAVLCPPFGRLEQARENVQTPYRYRRVRCTENVLKFAHEIQRNGSNRADRRQPSQKPPSEDTCFEGFDVNQKVSPCLGVGPCIPI